MSHTCCTTRYPLISPPRTICNTQIVVEVVVLIVEVLVPAGPKHPLSMLVHHCIVSAPARGEGRSTRRAAMSGRAGSDPTPSICIAAPLTPSDERKSSPLDNELLYPARDVAPVMRSSPTGCRCCLAGLHGLAQQMDGRSRSGRLCGGNTQPVTQTHLGPRSPMSGGEGNEPGRSELRSSDEHPVGRRGYTERVRGG